MSHAKGAIQRPGVMDAAGDSEIVREKGNEGIKERERKESMR